MVEVLHEKRDFKHFNMTSIDEFQSEDSEQIKSLITAKLSLMVSQIKTDKNGEITNWDDI